MTLATLMLRSLRFYWRTHLGVVLGTAVTCAILTGALAVGDSVRATLERLALARLGRTELALASTDTLFREQLADELQAELRAPVAPALVLRGSASVPDGRARANDVQVVGAGPRFWEMGGAHALLEGAGADEAVVNERLAAQLGVRGGDGIVVRVEPPSPISRDAPLSGRSDTAVALRLRVRAVAGDADFGRFSLQANQVPPLTVFLPLAVLQAQLQRPGRANVLLAGAGATAAAAPAAVRARWTLADAGLEVRALPEGGGAEVRTERVFIDPLVAGVATNLAPGAAGVLTYFVNEIRKDGRATPYSFVAACDAAVPGAGEVAINRWLADDLGARPGDALSLRYFAVGPQRELREETAEFRVGAVVPTRADSSWMPAYPGLSDVTDCRRWAPGVPVAADRIRPQDEAYWNGYRGTPKAFVSLAAGQKIWANRFGHLTAVRYPPSGPAPAEVAEQLRARLDPAALGLHFVPVRENALAAGRQSMDFGQLFIGFSFFLIVAALMLTAMLFVFNLEQRLEQIGLLGALGFRPAQVRRIVLAEGFCLAAAGAVAGAGAGVVYTRLALYGLSTVWRGAVGGATFAYHVEPVTLLLGAGLGLLSAFGAMWIAQRGPARRAPAELLAGGADVEPGGALRGWKAQRGLWTGIAGALGAAALLAGASGGHGAEQAGAFFGAGACLLIAGLGFAQRLLVAMARTQRTAGTVAAVGRRNAARRRGRSLTTVGVLASGVFLLVAVNAFHADARRDARARSSGTGGFALYAQSALAVYDNLNRPEGRRLFGLSDAAMQDVAVLPLRVREGDEASCLNLNRAQQPRLLGVAPAELERRGAFRFAATSAGAAAGWPALDVPAADGAVPAIGDEPTVTWALGKALGDTLPYTDERGRTFTIRIVGVLAGSILQGGLLVSESRFVERFPSTGGYRAFLVDAPAERAVAVAADLTRALQDRGLEVVPAWRRLADFLAVENTYLGIFQVLGGLGLLLGSVGLGLVVMRNVLERRRELALLQAVGFGRPALVRLVLVEHGLLVALGLGIGLASATLAVAPALGAGGAAELPVGLLAATLAGLAAGGVLWSWLAARASLRGPLLPALRNE